MVDVATNRYHWLRMGLRDSSRYMTAALGIISQGYKATAFETGPGLTQDEANASLEMLLGQYARYKNFYAELNSLDAYEATRNAIMAKIGTSSNSGPRPRSLQYAT